MKKLLLGILLTLGLIASVFGLVACGETPQEKSEIEKIYDSYVTYSVEQGISAMSYSDWLATIKGKDGKDGTNGKDGVDGKDGTNGKDGENGQSAYELYKKYHTDYTKTEQEFIDDLVNGRLGEEQDKNEQGIAFYLQDDGTYSVGIGNAEELSKIVIPATYNGKAVTKIKNNFANSLISANQTLKEVTIPNSIKTIGYAAFEYCSSLTSITIGDSVESIGSYAFKYCSSLTSIAFSDSSNWYRTSSYDYWENKTGGTLTDLSNASTNATYFKSTYSNYYWYKLDNK